MNISLMYGMLNHLMMHERTSAKELADVFEINPRSVYRYIDQMAAQNIPVETQIGRGGGIFIDKNFKLERALLTVEEREYLKSILSTQNSQLAKTLLDKLKLF